MLSAKPSEQNQFDKLVEQCNKVGITYFYCHNANEQYRLRYKDKVWSRASSAGIMCLMQGMLHAIEKGRL
jgi:hypothetical protein